jgi:hypothetical protein
MAKRNGTARSRMMAAAAVIATAMAGAALMPASAADGPGAVPMFSPFPNSGWVPDRPTGDDFIPVAGQPSPVMSDPKHPYVPNGGGRQPTYRVADLTNPILKPWAVEKMKKANDEVLAGKVPYITRERCWPAGVPGSLVFTRGGQPLFFYQTKDKITIVNELNFETRHIYLNVQHTKNPKPSWYGESVGHFEGDELVIDTIGLNDRTTADNYRTPHTDQIHVVERYKLIEGGKTLQATVTVDDPGTFNMAWTGVQRWKKTERILEENPCAENNSEFLGYDVVPIPMANKPDF